jgi:hypothetical protein
MRKQAASAIIEMRRPRPKEICISVTDAAAMLDSWPGAVLKLCRNGELQAWRMVPRGRWHIVLDSVREYVARKSALENIKAR